MLRSYDTLHGLSGTLWPIHLKPLPSELLSSWIIRLAHAHGMKAQSLCQLLFGRAGNVWSRDIDRLAPDWVKDGLLRVTGATGAQFERTTLRSFEGLVFERIDTKNMIRGLLPLGIYHRKRTRPGLMWCPLCLQEDANPYFRKTWRLAYFTVCIYHRVYLEDVCPVCRAPVAPHRADMRGYNVLPSSTWISCCFQCGRKLKEYQPKLADEASLNLNRKFELAISQGFIDWDSNPSLHSVLFFYGIRALLAGLLSKSGKGRLLASSLFAEMPSSPSMNSGLEFISLESRRTLMRVAADLLDNWPKAFVDLIQRFGLRYCDLKGDLLDRPYWYEKIIRQHAHNFSPPIGIGHAESIAKTVERRFGIYTQSMARMLSGHDLSGVLSHRRPQPISNDLYLRLMVSLDGEIAQASCHENRAVLLRDKLMFATGRVLDLPTTHLSTLTLVECRRLVPIIEQADFSTPPTTAEQMRAWLEWYWIEIRPALRPKSSEYGLFVSSRSGRSLKRSAISFRFNRAVGRAGLSEQIATFGSWRAK